MEDIEHIIVSIAFNHLVQPFSSEEKLKCHMNRWCFNVVGTIRILPNKNEKGLLLNQFFLLLLFSLLDELR